MRVPRRHRNDSDPISNSKNAGAYMFDISIDSTGLVHLTGRLDSAQAGQAQTFFDGLAEPEVIEGPLSSLKQLAIERLRPAEPLRLAAPSGAADHPPGWRVIPFAGQGNTQQVPAAPGPAAAGPGGPESYRPS